ncbi:MAG: hypothetical protein ABI577_18395 [bacterium]
MKTTIQIATVDGPESVEAEVLGDLFAVHRDLTPTADRWTMTHMPTGMMALSGIENEYAAIALAERLLGLGEEFWKVPKNCHFGESAPPEVSRIMRRWKTDLEMGLD